jgi:hypothetical protein
LYTCISSFYFTLLHVILDLEAIPSSSSSSAVAANAAEDFDCHICMEHFTEGGERDPTMFTLCGHYFCLKCVNELRKVKSQCPECSVPIEDSQIARNLFIVRQLGKHVGSALASPAAVSAAVSASLSASANKSNSNNSNISIATTSADIPKNMVEDNADEDRLNEGLPLHSLAVHSDQQSIDNDANQEKTNETANDTHTQSAAIASVPPVHRAAAAADDDGGGEEEDPEDMDARSDTAEGSETEISNYKLEVEKLEKESRAARRAFEQRIQKHKGIQVRHIHHNIFSFRWDE